MNTHFSRKLFALILCVVILGLTALYLYHTKRSAPEVAIGVTSSFEIPRVPLVKFKLSVSPQTAERIQQKIADAVYATGCTDGPKDPDALQHLRDDYVYYSRIAHDSTKGNVSPQSEIMNWSYEEITRHLYNDFNLYWEASSSVVYQDDDYISVEIDWSNECGGPHPNAGSIGLTFDLGTGEEIKTRDLFADFSKDERAIGTVMGEYAKAHPNEYNAEECNLEEDLQNELVRLEYLQFALSKDGVLLLSLGYPYPMLSCEPRGLVIPWKLLSPYLSSSFASFAK